MIFMSLLCHFHPLKSNYLRHSRLLKRLHSLFFLTRERLSFALTKTVVKTVDIIVVVVVVVVVVFRNVVLLSAIKATRARRRKR